MPFTKGSVCSAINCSNNRKISPNTSFFRFPRAKERSKQWLVSLRRADLMKKDIDYLYKNIRLCALHFEDCMFMNVEKKKLVWNAVPTLFDVPNPPPWVTPKRKIPNGESSSGILKRCQVSERIEMIPTMAYDFDSVCRLCTKADANLHQIFIEANNLCSKIREISPKLQVFIGDGLPTQVCEKCLQQVDMCCNFRLQCEESDAIFRHYLSSLNSEEVIPKSHAADSGDESVVFKEEAVTCVLEDVKQEPASDNSPEYSKEFTLEDEEEDSHEPTEAVAHKSRGDENTCSEIKKAVISFASEELHQVLLTNSETESREQSVDGIKVEVQDFEENLCDSNNHEYARRNERMCVTCSEIFISKESQKQHTCSTPYRCLICMKVLPNEEDLCTHMSTHNMEPCRLCGKIFSDKSYYMSHIRAHGGIGFKCKYCSKIYSSSTACNIHCRKHTGEKPYVCEVCGERFLRAQGFNIHLRKHTGERPFQCPTCLKRFPHSNTLQNHIRIHTGEKPFVCEMCGIQFRDQSGLWCHKKNIHVERERKFKCSLCSRVYMDRKALRTHSRKHSGERPFMCEICGKAFTIKNILTKHMVVHTGDKRYGCTVCKRTFSSSSSRSRHVRTHTGETPYGCATCNKAFSLRRDLVNHVLKFKH